MHPRPECRNPKHAETPIKPYIILASTKQKEHLVAGNREKEGEGTSRTCSIQQWNFRIGSTTTDGDQPVADFIFL